MMACMVSEDLEPVIHDVYAPSSQTWQYVVVDPSTRHCVLIDPVMDPGTSHLSGKPADEVLGVVCKNKYKVDIIVETHASSYDNRSGAWYLRMQLRDIQGYAPRVSSGQAVSGVEKLFARKYGTSLQTNLDGDFKDGEQLEVGRISMKVLHLPGICTPEGRGYQIGVNIFGGYSIADLKNRMNQDNFKQQIRQMSEDDCHGLWVSFQKLLGLPPDFRLYFDRGEANVPVTPRVRFNDDEELDARPERRKGVQKIPFTTVAHCRTMSNPVDRTAAEFMTAWEAGRGVQQHSNTSTSEHTEHMTPRAGEKSTKENDPVPVRKLSRMASFFGRTPKE